MPVAIPEPKSSDLQSPVPNDQANLPSVDDIASHFAKPLPAAPAEAQPQISPDDIAAHFASQPDQGTVDKNGTPAGELTVMPSQHPVDNFKENVKELATLAGSSLSGSLEAKLDYWKNAFGEKNAKIQDGKIYFRAEGDKTFRPVTKGLMSGMGNVIASHAELVPFTAAAIPAGEAGGPLAAGAAGSLAVTAADKGVRQIMGMPQKAEGGSVYNAVKSLGGSQDDSSIGNQVLDAGINAAETGVAAEAGAAAFEGASALAKPVFSKVGDYGNQVWNMVADRLPERRLQQVVALKQSINGILRDTGTLFGPTEEETGNKVASKLSQLQDMHESRVDVLKDEMQKETNGEPFKIDLDPIKDFLKKKGFQTGPTAVDLSEDTIKAKAAKASQSLNSEEGLSFDDVTATPLKEAFAEPIKRQHILDDGLIHDPSLNLARESNQGNVKSLINRINQIEVQNKDGFDYRTLDNTIGALKTGSGFTNGVPHSTELQGIYQNIYGLLAKQRDNIIEETASQSDNEALKSVASSALKDFNTHIDNLKYWTDSFQKSDAAKVSRELISRTDSKSVADLKQLLMSSDKDGVDAWQTLKGRWLSNIFSNSADNPNFPDGKAIIKELESYTPEVRDQLFDKVEYAKLKNGLEKLDKIKTSDFTAKAPDINAAKIAFQASYGGPISMINAGTSTANYAMYQTLSKNKALADYMANQGFFDLAEKAPTFAEKAGWTNAAKTMQTYLSNSAKVEGENGIEQYEAGPELKSLFAAVLAHNGIEQKQKPNLKTVPKKPTIGNTFGNP